MRLLLTLTALASLATPAQAQRVETCFYTNSCGDNNRSTSQPNAPSPFAQPSAPPQLRPLPLNPKTGMPYPPNNGMYGPPAYDPYAPNRSMYGR
jgi:hypothetical protein